MHRLISAADSKTRVGNNLSSRGYTLGPRHIRNGATGLDIIVDWFGWVDFDYTTMILAGSLQAPMTPLSPAVRMRIHTVLPGALPFRVALPPLNVPACVHPAALF